MFFAPVVRTRAYAPALRSYDRSFERFINDAFFTQTFPGVQVAQDDKAWTITLDVPGLTKEDLNIGIEGNVVRIDSRKEPPRAYKAAYELPQDIDVAQSGAKLENGVLTLTLAKLLPVSQVNTLNIS